MKNKTPLALWVVLIICGVFIARIIYGGIFFDQYTTGREDVLENNIEAVSGIHAPRFFDKNLFQEAIRQAKEKNKVDAVRKMKAGVVPHHLLASFIIADFFKALSYQDIHTVILIGPNHYEKGGHNIISSEYEWNTPFGTVGPDKKIIAHLREKNIIKIDAGVIEEEHSLGGITPFVKYYLPEASVVPLALSAKNEEEDIKSLSEALERYAKEDGVVLVASIDFSHYLSSFDAEKKDEETLEAIQEHQYRTIASFNNDYMDSPSSLISLMRVADNLNWKGPEIMNHTNSGRITGSEFEKTTSYISLYYYQ